MKHMILKLKHRNSLLLGFALMSFLSPALHAEFKCWTNAEGVRECGNVVPPEFAQGGHETITEQGTVVERVDRAKTKEELAEEARLEELAREEERKRQEQEMQDRVLLNTFSNEDEILMTRDGKLLAVETEIRITRKNIENTKNRLRSLRASAANMERSGKPVSAALSRDIRETEMQLKNYQQFIENKQLERETIKQQFADDIQRFRRLKGIN
jgi:hypothetical protein